MSAPRLTAVRGMNDVLPADSAGLERLEAAARRVLRAYGYGRVRTPVVESTAVFRRGLGEVTDIVEKEMYTFTDELNGESLTLRPENTAGVVRAAIEHSLLHNGPCRLWYYGPMYRHERPQRGRYREFFQVGAEALGLPGPEVEVEQILLLSRLWAALELPPLELQLNTLGDPSERLAHRARLVDYLEAHRADLDPDSQRRIQGNPLRVLDSKNPRTQEILAGAPRLSDFLLGASRAHFDQVQSLLTGHGLAFRLNERLVRGMDYYNRTVFEWVTDRLGAQATVCGGGRYDGLFELLGGKPTPAVGFSIGVERILALMPAAGPADECEVYVAHQAPGGLAAALKLGEALRDRGLRVIVHPEGASFKSQLRRADASGARFAALLGEDELAGAQVTLKGLREGMGLVAGEAAGAQRRVALAQAPELLARCLGANPAQAI